MDLEALLDQLTGNETRDPALDRAMTALAKRADTAVRDSTDELIRLHGLSGSAREEILKRVGGEFEVQAAAEPAGAGVLGAIVSGGLFLILGHWLGGKLMEPETQKKIHEFKEWFAAGAVVVGIGLVVWIIWRKRNSQRIIAAEVKIVEKAEQAKDKMISRMKPKPGEKGPEPTTPASPIDPTA